MPTSTCVVGRLIGEPPRPSAAARRRSVIRRQLRERAPVGVFPLGTGLSRRGWAPGSSSLSGRAGPAGTRGRTGCGQAAELAGLDGVAPAAQLGQVAHWGAHPAAGLAWRAGVRQQRTGGQPDRVLFTRTVTGHPSWMALRRKRCSIFRDARSAQSCNHRRVPATVPSSHPSRATVFSDTLCGVFQYLTNKVRDAEALRLVLEAER